MTAFTHAEIEHAVLRALRADARASYTSIAGRLGITRQVVAGIVDTVVAEKRVRLTATVSPDLMGITRYSYILIATEGPSDPILRELEAVPETCFVSALAGTFGADAEIRVTSDEHHESVLGRIRSIPGVASVICNVYERILINVDSPLPASGAPALRVDAADQAILFELERNGRASFRDLGDAANVAPSSARNRLHRLLRHHAVKLVGLPVRDHQIGPPPLGLGMRVRGALTSDLISRIAALGPEFLAVSSGTYDLISTASAETPEELLATLDALHRIDEISLVHAWSHLRIVKENYGITGLERAIAGAAPLARR